MVTTLMLISGVISGSLLSVLVGLVGARRYIGFSLALLLSLFFTPLIGLIITLISDPLPGEVRRWGCLPILIGVVGLLFLAVMLLLLITGGAIVSSVS